jgi:excinuclease ABC subunit C
MLESLLDEIPGLGESRRGALIENFGSVAALRKANINEIAAVPGIGEKTAMVIHEKLSATESTIEVDAQTGEIIEHP